MHDGIVLLKALLLSTSQRNIYRHTTDGRKRRRIVANAVGFAFLYLLIMAYCVTMCVGYGVLGMAEAVPALCALTLSALAFVFTLFKTNGYLFNFKEYDMLMSLPFEARTVAGCKFLCMYVKSLLWYASISLSMMVGYGVFAHPPVVAYLAWTVLFLFLPIIPMLAAALVGFLIAKLSAGFKKTNIVQTVLMFAFVLAFFSLRFVMDDLFRNDKVELVLGQMSAMTNDAARSYPPAGWFADAITRSDALGALLLVGVSVALFAIVFRIVGQSYRSINSALRSHAAKGRYHMTAQRRRSVVGAIAFKELKRMTGSSTYMVNGAMGEVLAVLLGVATLVIGFDKIVDTATQGAPIDVATLRPAIPFIVYFLIGMVATTAFSPSLEGKNYWILQSLPIEMRTVYQGKMLFNLCLTVPFMAFATVCLCVSAQVPVLDTALYLLLGLALCAFSTAWGCVCGVRHMRLDWENEVEVIKQGTALVIYLFPNMFVTMGLTVLVVFLGMRFDCRLVALAFTLLATALAALSYLWILRATQRDH